MQKLLKLPQVRLFSKFMFVFFVIVIAAIAFLPNYDNLPEVVSISGIINHFVAFFVLAFFLDNGYQPTIKNAFVVLFAYGFLIEVVQYFLSNRCFELLDLLVDISGVFMFYFLSRSLRRV